MIKSRPLKRPRWGARLRWHQELLSNLMQQQSRGHQVPSSWAGEVAHPSELLHARFDERVVHGRGIGVGIPGSEMVVVEDPEVTRRSIGPVPFDPLEISMVKIPSATEPVNVCPPS